MFRAVKPWLLWRDIFGIKLLDATLSFATEKGITRTLYFILFSSSYFDGRRPMLLHPPLSYLQSSQSHPAKNQYYSDMISGTKKFKTRRGECAGRALRMKRNKRYLQAIIFIIKWCFSLNKRLLAVAHRLPRHLFLYQICINKPQKTHFQETSTTVQSQASHVSTITPQHDKPSDDYECGFNEKPGVFAISNIWGYTVAITRKKSDLTFTSLLSRCPTFWFAYLISRLLKV